MSPRIARIGNRIGVWTYTRTAGRLAGGSGAVLLLTVPGRRTGQPRSSCMRYLRTDEGLVVWGTASGAPADPDWFRNLRAAERAGGSISARIGGDTTVLRPRELLGVERDRVWGDLVLARAPEVARYAAKAGRTIPVAVLEPV